MRSDGSVCSDWLEVEQELRQRHVLSPLLLNTVFAAVPTVILERFSEDKVILVELVHLKEPTASMGPEPTMDYVVRCGMNCMRMTLAKFGGHCRGSRRQWKSS